MTNVGFRPGTFGYPPSSPPTRSTGRPVAATVASLLLLFVGAVGLVGHAGMFVAQRIMWANLRRYRADQGLPARIGGDGIAGTGVSLSVAVGIAVALACGVLALLILRGSITALIITMLLVLGGLGMGLLNLLWFGTHKDLLDTLVDGPPVYPDWYYPLQYGHTTVTCLGYAAVFVVLVISARGGHFRRP